MKAKAAVYVGANKPFEIREYEIQSPNKGYVGMSLIASGVCGTDLHIHNGKLGGDEAQIIGHEFIGTIREIDEETAEKYGLAVGDAVISDIAVPCGECLLCQTGDDANCVYLGVTNAGDPDTAPHFHGGYAEYSFAPAENLIKIPEGVDPTMAAVCACPGPTAIHAVRLSRQAGYDPAQAKVAVVQGLGPVGNFGVAYLAAMGIPHVIAVISRPDEARAELAKKLGATQVFDLETMTEEEILAKVNALTDGLGADLVFEASGNPKAIPMGINLLRNRGVYLVPGQYSESGGVEIQPQLITFKALRILGSSQYSLVDVQDYVSFLAENPRLHETLAGLATCYPVEEVNQAFADAKARKNVKTLLVK